MAVIVVTSMAIITVFAVQDNSVTINLYSNQGVARADYIKASTRNCRFSGKNDAKSAHRVYIVPKYRLVNGAWHDIGSRKILLDAGASIAADDFKVANPESPAQVEWSVELNVQYLFQGCTANAKAELY